MKKKDKYINKMKKNPLSFNIEEMYKKKYLILDISIKTQIVILATENKIIDIITNSSYNKFVENMVPLIDKITKKNSIKLKKIDGIIVGKGPGSFIGTRVAILTSKIISLNISIPLYCVSSLILLSSGYINKNKTITPKIYANNNLYYSTSLKNKKVILTENIYEEYVLNKFDNNLLLNISNIKLSLFTIFYHMKKVKNIHKLYPSYYDKKL
ncbi:tRNA (adenosine(37)-N6)-threonylcarbamoyltransferase complex dimerization subunit type 1 TsaB [Candidatus Phytoplasma sacchari]|uniref:tRNA (Adenosine(37)-N6)-threonylcarbamoyltransferase complex dimerization subunit type 1 TsaB n=1 Tax=Candidatus Phytoplasma sacchari TaxID=2609813 RepID=A0ABY7M106_9MOLU|nr:tRNA (adenosine(37)-N6)-threonylcarbamoyltransferase complex dimerization subunit type 1 TsaB [Candidatus Phytoplasma sacchari]